MVAEQSDSNIWVSYWLTHQEYCLGGEKKKIQLKLHKNGVLTNPGAAGKVAAELKSKLETFEKQHRLSPQS